jgi:regulatory protein
MPSPKKQKILTETEALQKIMAFCSYQERSPWEVLKKLYGFGLEKDIAEKILEYLKNENFLNESRFIQSYAGGKFRLKKWGKLKVEHALRGHQMNEQRIDEALSVIQDDEYEQTLKQILLKKNNSLKEPDLSKRQDKLYRYALQKGYESDLVLSVLKEILVSGH